ncbi:MAG TPA: hypothetical protein PLM71_10525 [Syntrophorhabdaceae bacterium]|nr:hypothetical protein [Syntrophorhabdaceae bacterium]
MPKHIAITIDSKYHRSQFDDWLAGGKVEYKGKTYYWSAQDNNYGFGWQIEPITDVDWNDFSDSEFDMVIKLIKKCLEEHINEYIF